MYTRLAISQSKSQSDNHETRWGSPDEFTLADLTGYVFVDFARIVKMRIPEGNTATQAWFDRIAARPSAQV